ncbi:MAG: YegS/Rv2252/BmrU family lipid kinase [Calditrichia bacterium]|nr:YegS/Rv2252/BmrU family lipid kinase [Calditrichia bacterium]
MKIKKSYWIIINPKSGFARKGNSVLQLIEQNISNFSGEVKLIETKYKGQGKELAQQAINEKVDVVVAVGGDGTINDIAGGLVKSNVHFGVIPTGSGNGFARNFGIPLNLNKAIELLSNYKKTLIIDCGEINSKYFFNVAGIGLDALIAKKFDTLGVRGLFPYFIVGIKALIEFKYPEVLLYNEKGERKIKSLSIVIANGRQYGGGAIIAPMASYSDGVLDLVISNQKSIFQFLKDLPKLYNGTLHKAKKIEFSQISNLELEISEKSAVHIDGEPVSFKGRVKINAVPKALKVISEMVN